MDGYFGANTLYRLLRPLTLAELIERHPNGGLARLASLVDGTSPGRDPVFWCRLVAYGYVANWLLRTEGGAVAYSPMPYPVTNVLGVTNDAQLDAVATDMPRRLESMIDATAGGDSTASRPRRWRLSR